jgi:hypothetical protein
MFIESGFLNDWRSGGAKCLVRGTHGTPTEPENIFGGTAINIWQLCGRGKMLAEL